MRQKKPMSLYLPDEVDAWIKSEAGKQRMSKSDFVYTLLTKGVLAETIDASVARLEAAVERGGITRELLAQNLATQYMVEQVAAVVIKNTTTLRYDARSHAERELEKIWPKAAT